MFLLFSRVRTYCSGRSYRVSGVFFLSLKGFLGGAHSLLKKASFVLRFMPIDMLIDALEALVLPLLLYLLMTSFGLELAGS